MHFFINTKTQEIHSAKCSILLRQLGLPSAFHTDFKLYINLEVAKKQGVEFSEDILKRADKLISQ